MTERLCIVCPARGRTAVLVLRLNVCEPCRVWLATTLAGIQELLRELAADRPLPDTRPQYHVPHIGPLREPGQRRPRAHESEYRDCDPVAAQLPSRANGARVRGDLITGSHEPALPINEDLVDLTAPPRPGSIGVRYRFPWRSDGAGDPDQIGHLSVATELEFWAQDWIAMRGAGERLPEPNAYALAAWLSEPARLEWACNHNPALDELAGVLRRIHGALRAFVPREVGEDHQRPEHLNAPCPSCDLLTLVRIAGEERVDCANPECRRVLIGDEYAQWSSMLLASARRTA